MKRKVATILVCIFTILSLSGCSSQGTTTFSNVEKSIFDNKNRSVEKTITETSYSGDVFVDELNELIIGYDYARHYNLEFLSDSDSEGKSFNLEYDALYFDNEDLVEQYLSKVVPSDTIMLNNNAKYTEFSCKTEDGYSYEYIVYTRGSVFTFKFTAYSEDYIEDMLSFARELLDDLELDYTLPIDMESLF